MLASAATADSARIVTPDDGPSVPAPAVRVVIMSGMAGWQINDRAGRRHHGVLLNLAWAVRRVASAAAA